MCERVATLSMAVLILFSTGLTARTAAGPEGPARQDEGDDVRAAVERVFDGMREADAAKVRSVFAEGARFASSSEEEGSGVVYAEIDGWLQAIDRSEGRWDERIFDVRIDVDGPMASAWVPYRFYLDGALRHCGVNSVELLRTADGWKITQLSDTRRTEGCDEAGQVGRPGR